jgi:hypothetical protein
MRNISVVLLLLCFLSACSFGGDKPDAAAKPVIFLTGNPSIDLFSHADIDRPGIDFGDTTVSSMSSQSSPGGKSVWTAAGLSLVVPGAGQVYDNNYLKAGIFAAIEVASLVTYFNFNAKGNDQTTFFENYAAEHYSPIQYAEWTQQYAGTLNPGVEGSSYNVINPKGSTTPPFSKLNWAQLNQLESAIEAGGLANGYTHQLPYFGQQQYYELIGKYFQFSTGWDDANLAPPGTVSGDAANGTGYRSQEQLLYANYRALANHYYDIAYTWVSIAVVNHVVSAFDAYLSTKSFNKSLHAQLEINAQPTPYGVEIVPDAKLTFNF